MRLYVVLAILVCGCVKDDLVDCGNGLACPANTRCDDIHGSCATADQFAACIGLVDGDACTANQLNGFCDRGVCIRPGCGNHVIEANEACDDGNHTSGDGCSADCTSNESCGNGVLDTIAGEACDDGNLVSRDGCDSQCQNEPLTFDITGIEPTHANPGWSTFDQARGEVVHFSDGFLWAFNGTTWKIISTSGPTDFSWYQVVYDQARHKVVVVGPASPSIQAINDIPLKVWEWDETTWTQRTPATKALFAYSLPGTAVFEPKTALLLVVGVQNNTPTAYELGDDWKPTAVQPAITTGIGLTSVYDKSRDVAVIGNYRLSGNPDTLEWDGAAWTVVTTALPNGKSGFTLGFDRTLGALGKVVAVGGALATIDVSQWDPVGKTWTLAPALPKPRQAPEVVSYTAPFDGFLFGGTDDLDVDRDEVYLRNDGSGFSAAKLDLPSTNSNVTYRYAFDDANARLVAVREEGARPNETWIWDGTAWNNNVDSTQLPSINTPIAFDPKRRVVIATSGLGTYELDPSGWAKLFSAGTGNQAITYDPDGGRLFAIGGNVNMLTSTDSSWHQFTMGTPPMTRPSLAFDARDHQLVLIDAVGGATYTLDTTVATPAWVPTVSPGPQGYSVVEDRRRGTVWFLSKGQAIWERASGNWALRGTLPFAVDGPSVYSANGDMITIGDVGSSRVMVRRTYENGSPIETCVAGQDIDGDGLSGCDDPDCYAPCGTCPPFGTCL